MEVCALFENGTDLSKPISEPFYYRSWTWAWTKIKGMLQKNGSRAQEKDLKLFRLQGWRCLRSGLYSAFIQGPALRFRLVRITNYLLEWAWQGDVNIAVSVFFMIISSGWAGYAGVSCSFFPFMERLCHCYNLYHFVALGDGLLFPYLTPQPWLWVDHHVTLLSQSM